MVSTLETLPSELYTAILERVDALYLASTTHALLCALPRVAGSRVAIAHLFKVIYIKRPDQVFGLYKRLRKSSIEASYVHELYMQSWTVDADLLVGLMRLLREIRVLNLWVGPNFAPEHMEYMLEAPQVHLQVLHLRFRPYVKRATYDQFLKGAYFDSTLTKLASWPKGNMAHATMVQDPYDIPPDQQTFAQPLVFFRLDTISELARSPLVQQLPALRLRVPHRPVARYLAVPGPSPAIRVLDLSTSSMSGAEIDPLLARLTKLEALILDGCALVRAGAGGEEDWRAVGHVCATASLRVVRERERRLRAWLEHKAAIEAVASPAPVAQPPARLNSRAKINAKSRKGVGSLTAGMQGLSMSSGREVVLAVPKIRILPAYPRLRALSTTVPFLDDLPFDVKEALAEGWRDGVRVIQTTRSRLRTSLSNGVRIVRIDDTATQDESVDQREVESGMSGLIDVNSSDVAWEEDHDAHPAPVFCLAGPEKHVEHSVGCAHEYSWEIWSD